MQHAHINRRTLLLALSVAFLSGCASTPGTSLQTSVLRPDILKDYKQAYIEIVGEDEFQVGAALTIEMTDIGLEVLADPPQNKDRVLRVRAMPIGGWDLSRYLQSLQIQLSSAATGKVEVTTHFRSNGLWMGARDKRLKLAFNDLRSKLGLPPSTQFP